MSRVFTMSKTCPKCRTYFTITSAASVYCQNKDCQNRRRRDDRADRKAGRGAYARLARVGPSTGDLAAAIESGK